MSRRAPEPDACDACEAFCNGTCWNTPLPEPIEPVDENLRAAVFSYIALSWLAIAAVVLIAWVYR